MWKAERKSMSVLARCLEFAVILAKILIRLEEIIARVLL